MTRHGQVSTGLRRFAASQVMCTLALLVALLLPLQGIANAFFAISSPAHYHRLAQGTTVAHQDHDHAAEHHHDHEGGSSVAHHPHALDAVDVVYLDDDSERTDQSTPGKHLTLNGDALLPGWWMPVLPDVGAQLLPDPGCNFRSHPAAPPMRPPSADILHSA